MTHTAYTLDPQTLAATSGHTGMQSEDLTPSQARRGRSAQALGRGREEGQEGGEGREDREGGVEGAREGGRKCEVTW